MTRMEIEVPDVGTRAVARLYDGYAPKTIRALTTVLTFTGPGIHAIRAGREVFTLLPATCDDPGEENQSVFPILGDLYLFHQHEGFRPIELPIRLRAEKGTIEYSHIVIWYGRDSFPLSPTGVYPDNHFGEIEIGLPELADACERIRFEDIRNISYRMMEE